MDVLETADLKIRACEAQVRSLAESPEINVEFTWWSWGRCRFEDPVRKTLDCLIGHIFLSKKCIFSDGFFAIMHISNWKGT